MLYVVKLQGIYTAYSYLSVRATVDLPLPENSVHAIYSSFTSLPSAFFCTHFKTAKGHLLYQLQGEVVKKIAKEIQIGYNNIK